MKLKYYTTGKIESVQIGEQIMVWANNEPVVGTVKGGKDFAVVVNTIVGDVTVSELIARVDFVVEIS